MAAVLVVDDERDTARIVADFLTSCGHDVVVAHDGTEALDVSRRRVFDVVLLDIVMPGLDGVETMRRMKAERSGPVFIMISGVSDERTAVVSLELGAFDYIMKPFDFRHLERVISLGLALRG